MPTIFDAFYVLALILGSPFFLSKIFTNKRFRTGLRERLGLIDKVEESKQRIWIHCASVGEVLAVKPLVKCLEKEFQGHELVISVNTDTGMSVAKKSFCGKRIFYFPIDLSWIIYRVLRIIRPKFIILVELEIWPNLIIAAAQKQIPIVLVNTRISDVSLKWYRICCRRSKKFFESLKKTKNIFCARTESDALRLKELGIAENQIFITGNMKYDNVIIEVPYETKKRLLDLFEIDGDERVIVAGSTFEGEEAIILKVFRNVCKKFNKLRLIVVPRHIERVGEITKQVESLGFNAVRKSFLDNGGRLGLQGGKSDLIIIVDTVGELLNIYGIADYVFVGRSLIPQGGQNMIEPAGLGRPVVVGPHTFNFKEEVFLLRESNAIRIVSDEISLLREFIHLLEHPSEAEEIGKRAQSAVIKQKGAVNRNIKILKENLLKERKY